MKKFYVFMICVFILGMVDESSTQHVYSDPLVHTYSIVARDPETGQMGVAVQSHWFSVGSIVSWAEAGVGAVATQSFVNASFGPRGLKMLKEGKTAKEVLKALIDADEGRDVRQLAIIDVHGNVEAHTGKRCIDEAGHIIGENFSVQANMMLKKTVPKAMANAFRNSQGPLAERMMAAMEAAQAEGGDIRGKQSAAIIVVKGKSSGKVWEDRIIDLRVEDHPEAVQEIKRVLKVYRAYEYMNAGDLALEHNDVEGALKAYGSAEAMFPDNLEMKYWHAISLANIGRIQESLPMFQEIFRKDNNWRLLTERLPKVELLNVDKKDLKRILSVE